VPELVERTRQYFSDQIPEAVGRVKRMWMGSEEPGFLEVRLVGLDPEYLFEKSEELVADIKALPGSLDVRSDWENKVLKITVKVDQTRARRAEVTSEDIANSLMAHMDGIKITEYREGDLAIPVLARSIAEERKTLSDLWNVSVGSTETGKRVPLTQIAELDARWDFSRIARYEQERTVTVEAKHETLKAEELLAAITPLIDNLDLREGYRWEVGGEIETRIETMGKLTRYMPACFFGIVVLLIWQFNSFRRPAIIFFTIPLAFTGAFIGLMIMRAPFDFFAMLGLLSLAGVIINNGIVLIDKIDNEQAAGKSAYDAVVMAALSRFRPILMTTVTTVLGVLPLIISRDPLFFAMACVLGWGLIFGTALTLGLVPALYATFFRVNTSTAGASKH
jgi:multidrug efflux pump subunit AcrB